MNSWDTSLSPVFDIEPGLPDAQEENDDKWRYVSEGDENQPACINYAICDANSVILGILMVYITCSVRHRTSTSTGPAGYKILCVNTGTCRKVSADKSPVTNITKQQDERRPLSCFRGSQRSGK
jgi:hypothetical protein